MGGSFINIHLFFLTAYTFLIAFSVMKYYAIKILGKVSDQAAEGTQNNSEFLNTKMEIQAGIKYYV